MIIEEPLSKSRISDMLQAGPPQVMILINCTDEGRLEPSHSKASLIKVSQVSRVNSQREEGDGGSSRCWWIVV